MMRHLRSWLRKTGLVLWTEIGFCR